jgi:intracellular sulfur oxidation DsrE/DsrF family protein
MFSRFITSIIFVLLAMPVAMAEPQHPWGRGEAQEVDYPPNKVVYDVVTSNMHDFELTLDRVSHLNNIYNADVFSASIVLVLHGAEIDYFAIKNFEKHKELMQRAQSLTVGTVIKIRMCRLAAKGRGYDPKDIHGFVEIVPMADAEIVRLQHDEGYAYMR